MNIQFCLNGLHFCKRLSVEFHEARSNVIIRFDRNDEDPPIADMTGPGFLDDDFYDIVNPVLIDHKFDHNLRQERHFVLMAPV